MAELLVIFLKGFLVKLGDLLDDTEQVLEDKDVILVEKEVIVFCARVALVRVWIIHALSTRGSEPFKLDQAFLARSNLNVIVPKRHI